jgi:hypothetical protein
MNRLACLAIMASLLLSACALIPEVRAQKEIYAGSHPVRITNASSVDVCDLVFISASRSHAAPGSYLDEPLRAGTSVVFEMRADKFGIGVRPCNDSRAIPAGLIDTTTAPEVVLLDKDGEFTDKIAAGYALHGPYQFHKPADADVLAARERERKIAARAQTQAARNNSVAVIHNRCPTKARLFLGSPRAFLRGAHVIVGPETRRSVRGQGALWLLNDTAEPIARVVLNGSVRYVTIASDCTTLTTGR